MNAINLGMPAVGKGTFEDHKRQLDICNACRYCAGYCPVWPALERRVDLTQGDVTHLANLCHDCRDCYLACMYTPPHEFGLNPPEMFALERTRTYERFIWPAKRLRGLSGPVAAIVAVVLVGVLIALLSLSTVGITAFGETNGSAYDVIRHDLLLVLVGAPAVYAVVVLATAALRYWRFTHGPISELFHLAAWGPALTQSLTLRHQAGAETDPGCSYDDAVPTLTRRFFHQAVAWGFILTFVSTLSAAVEQYFAGILPPYPLLSVPVIAGVIGGLGQIVGCIGLIRLKLRSERGQTTPVMWRADFAFLWALLVLNATGMLVLGLRFTPAFGAVLVIHLAAVVVAFAVAPYTKFVHFIFRVLAIYKNVLEVRPAGRGRLTRP